MERIRNSTDIAESLRLRRLRLGKSVAYVAKVVGVPRSTISRIESAKMNPSWDLVLAVSQALDLAPALIPREYLSAVEAVIATSETANTPLRDEDW